MDGERGPSQQGQQAKIGSSQRSRDNSSGDRTLLGRGSQETEDSGVSRGLQHEVVALGGTDRDDREKVSGPGIPEPSKCGDRFLAVWNDLLPRHSGGRQRRLELEVAMVRLMAVAFNGSIYEENCENKNKTYVTFCKTIGQPFINIIIRMHDIFSLLSQSYSLNYVGIQSHH